MLYTSGSIYFYLMYLSVLLLNMIITYFLLIFIQYLTENYLLVERYNNEFLATKIYILV